MSTLVTVQPTSVSDLSPVPPAWSAVGAGSLQAAVADDSDATYIDNSAAGSANAIDVAFGTPSIPATARIAEVAIFTRVRTPTGNNAIRAMIRLDGVTASSLGNVAGLWSSFASVTAVARSTKSDGTRWTAADLVDLEAFIYASEIAGMEIADIDGLVRYESEPTMTPATVSPASKPTIGWTFNDPDRGDVTAERVEVILVADGVTDGSVAAGTAGFDPTLAPQVYNSGTLLGVTSHQVTTPLGGGTYWAYVRGTKTWTIDSELWYSPWATSSAFTLVDAAPPPPQITSATPGADGSVEIAFRYVGNLLGFENARDGRILEVTNADTVQTSGGSSTADPLIGTLHGEFFRLAAGLASVQHFQGTTPAARTLHWSAGETIAASVWVKTSPGSGTEDMRARLTISEIGGGVLSSTEGSLFANESEYQRIGIVTTLPALVGSFGWEFLLEIEALAPDSGDEFYVDAACIRLGSDLAFAPGFSSAGGNNWNVEVQRSDDGIRWTTLPQTTDLRFGVVANDLIIDKGTAGLGTAQYRARAVPASTFTDGVGLESDWSTPVVLATNGVLDRWDLWDPSDDTQIVLNARAHPVTTEDRHVTFEPLESLPGITHSQTGRGQSGRLTVRTYSDAEFDALMAMVSSGRTLRLRTHLGRAWWIRVNGKPVDAQVRAKADDPNYSTAHLHDVTFTWRSALPPA
ncbi:MAG: hypothetical protein AAGA99_27875 [Actinomycetota bacterium]